MLRGTVGLTIVALLVAALVAGCGGKTSIAGSTPEATANAFIEAMKAGQYDRVAAGFDYETDARRENPDWDSFGEHQRDLIVEKLAERKAREVEALAGMFSGEASLTDIQKQSQTATAAVTAGANTIILRMRLTDGEWQLVSLEEQTQ